ncbi:MAG: hypothetical protein ABSG80_14510 [Verrucomicrobiota bacterium]
MKPKLELETKEWAACMSELKTLPNLTHRILRHARRLLRLSSKPGCIKVRAARGTRITATIEPSDGLRQLCMAIRTLKLNLLVVEYSAHNFMGDDRSQHNDQRSDPRG